jgi:hypothetical protein
MPNRNEVCVMPTPNPSQNAAIDWVTESFCMGRMRICRKWEGSDVRRRWLGRATIDVCSTSRYESRRIVERWATWTHPWSRYRSGHTRASRELRNCRIRPWTNGRHRHQLEPFERSRGGRWSTLLERVMSLSRGNMSLRCLPRSFKRRLSSGKL